MQFRKPFKAAFNQGYKNLMPKDKEERIKNKRKL